jgi:hypothetical protein
VTHASSAATSVNLEPKPGNMYLVEEKRPRASYALFDQVMSSGYPGLVVTRDFPKKLQSETEIGNCRILWLTNLVGDGRINPTAIGILMGQMRSFIETNQKSTIVLDGLEYLISLNTFERMLQFMHQLRDFVVTNDCIMFVPLDPRTVGQRELALFERSMEPVEAKEQGDGSEESILGHGDEGILRILDTANR